MPENETDHEALARRLERVEEALTLLLIERYGGDVSADLSGLRTSVRRTLPALSKEVRERIRDHRLDNTKACQWTGENILAVREFVGTDASVREDDGSSTVLWLVCRGQSTRLRAGSWLAKDSGGRVYTTPSPLEAT